MSLSVLFSVNKGVRASKKGGRVVIPCLSGRERLSSAVAGFFI